MDVKKPDWLSDEFIKNALTGGYELNNIEIKNIETKHALPKGENYTSEIFRVIVEFKRSNIPDEGVKSISLIIKSPILSGGTHDTINEIGTVEKELKIYYEFFPKLLKIIGENDEHMIAKCLPSSIENVIIMEDLNAEGYKLVDRFEQLDYYHAELVFRNLAKFHAASVKLVECDPNVIDEFGKELIYNKNIKISDKGFKDIDQILGKNQLKFLGKEIEKWPESKHYAEKIFKLMNKVWDIQHELFERKEDGFNVFVHGDLWSSNMLFKYSSVGKPVNVKFVDLQIMSYGDPVTDLMYFIYTSIQYDVIDKKLDELLQIYLRTLNEHLETYGCKTRLTDEQFKKSLEEKEIYGLLTCGRILLFVFSDKDEIVDLKEEVRDDAEYNRFEKQLKSKKFRSVYPKLLDHFSKKTWFQNL